MQKVQKKNPYTMDECIKMLDDGTWEGGYVQDEDSGEPFYMMKEATIHGYSGCSGSGDDNGSEDDFEFSTGSHEWHYPDSDTGSNIDEGGTQGQGSTGTGTNPGGNTGGGGNSGGGEGNTGGGTSGNGITLQGAYSSLSAYSQSVLRGLTGYKGNIYITSVARTPEEQARVMLSNIKKTSVEKQKEIYASPGDSVIGQYQEGKSDEENYQAMLAEIYRQGPSRVSKHCANFSVINVFDVSRARLSSVADFKRALGNAGIYFLDENNCIHVEISQ